MILLQTHTFLSMLVGAYVSELRIGLLAVTVTISIVITVIT